MSKPKKSGPAIFMYCVIAVSLVISAVCFAFYYSGNFSHSAILWIGVTAFVIMYHLWMRIIMGNVSKLFKVDYRHPWFSQRAFEQKFYELLRVKKWKDKALTYNPHLFSFKNYTFEQIATTMSKAELDHWINELISLSSLLFALVWGEFWIFLITAIAAMLFDAQFIVIQRYNRPRILRVMSQKINHQNRTKAL